MIKRGSLIKRKKGVSPTIATVLLIGMVVVISLIIFLWFKGLTKEAVVKFDKNVELVCDEVKFQASYSEGSLAISNIGNVPVYEMKVLFSNGESFDTKELGEISEWPASGLNQGGTFSDDLSGTVGNSDSITLVPVLVGKSVSGEKSYTCDENKYGLKINL